MAGFFTKEETKADLPVARRVGCGACGLNKKCKHPKMPVAGDGRKRILIISECPSATEDYEGQPLQGEGHQRLRRVTRKLGLHIDTDCWHTYAVTCHPPKSRDLKAKEIENCRPQLLKYIEEVKPHVIIPLGSAALRSLIGHRFKKDFGGIEKWRGFTIPDRLHEAWICPTYSQSFVLQSEKNPAVEVIWKQDILQAIKKAETALPYVRDEIECIEMVHDEKTLIKYLSALYRNEIALIGLDYETTGLKPHRKGQRIVSCAIAPEPDWCFTFLMPKKGSKAFILLKKIMEHPRVGKIAQNAKFEDSWNFFYLGADTQSWRWDTMLGARATENRPGVSGLKFIAYVNFGLVDYDSHLNHLLRPTDEEKAKYGANSFNRIDKIPREELLLYNGVDALLCRRLESLQQRNISDADTKHIR